MKQRKESAERIRGSRENKIESFLNRKLNAIMRTELNMSFEMNTFFLLPVLLYPFYMFGRLQIKFKAIRIIFATGQ